MERQWTDSRDGSRWTVTRVGGVGVREESGRAMGREAQEAPSSIVFHREGEDERYSLPTERAAGLEEMNDAQLEGLLDTAREGPAEPDEDLRDAEGEAGEQPKRRGSGEASPEAAGRESQPHTDPRRHGEASR